VILGDYSLSGDNAGRDRRGRRHRP
jgi:hypothetical protein